jgi:hypothetical protein
MAHKVLFALDLDRTLTEVLATNSLLEQVCTGFSVDIDALKNAQANAELVGESFQEHRYLLDNLDPRFSIAEVEQAFMVAAKDAQLLYNDAKTFINELDERNLPIIIVTYGERNWQSLKVRASGLDKYPCIVTNQKVKGDLIASWRKITGEFAPQGYDENLLSTSVVLVDDKAESFKSLPNDCLGFLIRRPNEKILESQKGDVGENVIKVASLSEIITILKEKRLLI